MVVDSLLDAEIDKGALEIKPKSQSKKIYILSKIQKISITTIISSTLH